MKQEDKECNPNVFGSSEEKMGTSLQKKGQQAVTNLATNILKLAD